MCPLARRLSACPSYWAPTHSLSKPLPLSLSLVTKSYHNVLPSNSIIFVMDLRILSGRDDCFKLVALVSCRLGRDAEPLLMPSHCHWPHAPCSVLYAIYAAQIHKHRNTQIHNYLCQGTMPCSRYAILCHSNGIYFTVTTIQNSVYNMYNCIVQSMKYKV